MIGMKHMVLPKMRIAFCFVQNGGHFICSLRSNREENYFLLKNYIFLDLTPISY